MVGKLLNVPSMVISISGQGYLYTKKNLLNLFLTNVYDIILKFIFSHKKQKNYCSKFEDYNKFLKIDKLKNCVIIPGSGVDTKNLKI